MREDSIPPVHLRLGELFSSVEDWRRTQPRIPARTDAIKELLRIALEAERQREKLHSLTGNESPGAP
jgi:hypothetical protein